MKLPADTTVVPSMTLDPKDVAVLNCSPGDKLRFAYPNNGYESDQVSAKKHLELDKVYTLSRIRVDKWFTVVMLEEVPDVRFNSVLFEVATN